MEPLAWLLVLRSDRNAAQAVRDVVAIAATPFGTTLAPRRPRPEPLDDPDRWAFGGRPAAATADPEPGRKKLPLLRRLLTGLPVR